MLNVIIRLYFASFRKAIMIFKPELKCTIFYFHRWLWKRNLSRPHHTGEHWPRKSDFQQYEILNLSVWKGIVFSKKFQTVEMHELVVLRFESFVNFLRRKMETCIQVFRATLKWSFLDFEIVSYLRKHFSLFGCPLCLSLCPSITHVCLFVPWYFGLSVFVSLYLSVSIYVSIYVFLSLCEYMMWLEKYYS